MADEQPPDLEDYSVVKFMEEDGEDNEIVESVEVVSSTWLSSDRKKSFWPPKSIPSDRAGRMAVQHAKPDPATWQNLVIIFVKSYKSASRARKNAKLVANGEEALDDKSTDYGKPRKRKKPSRLIEISDDDDEPSCPIRKRKNNKLQSDSDVPDSDGDIPAPCTNMEALQSKVDKAIAYRQVTPSKKTAKLKPLKTMVKLTQKCSIKDAVKQQGLKFNSAQSAGHQVIKAAGRVLATPCTSSKIGAPLSAELNAIGGGVKLFTDRSAKTKGKVLESAEATPSTRLNTGVINSAPIVDFDTIGEDSGFGDTSQVSLKSPLVDYESDFSANSEHASTSSLYPIEGRCENINYSHDDEENVKEVVQKFDKAIQTVAEKPARTAIHIQTSEKTGHQMQQYEQNEGLARLLKQVLVNQRRIISYVVPEKDQTAADFEELPDLPLKTEDDFDKFETYLNLKSQKQEAVKFFTSLFKEGMDEPKFVGKLMGEILSNSLARCVSWEGTEGTKIPFARSKTCNAIRLAVLKLFESSDLCKAEYKIQRWLNTSAQRH